MKKTSLIFTITLLCCSAALGQNTPLIDGLLRQKAETAVRNGTFPSLVVAVVEGNRVQVEGFGGATKPDGNTIFEIGSATKTFTALLLADASVRGEVTLRQPVQELLPGYRIPKSVTLLDLATQSSGLPRLPSNLFPKNPEDPYADYTAVELKQFLAGFRAQYEPGQHYEYSNLGFGLLGHALETRARHGYAELVHSRILEPLKMPQTGTALTPTAGHDATGKPVAPWNFVVLSGAGALRSTANDLIVYLHAHMHPAGPLAKALAMVTKRQRGTDRADSGIALAWQIDSREGHDIIWHNGMTGGSAAFIGFSADGKRGVVVLSNISRDVTSLGFAALVPETAATTSPKEMTVDPKRLAEYEGRYRLAPNFDLTVRATPDGLNVQATNQPSIPVFASARDEFFYKAVDAQLSFKRDAQGRVNSVILHQNGQDVPGPRVDDAPPAAAEARKEIAIDAATLPAYAGRYSLAPGFQLDVTVEKDQLFVQATGQPRFPVYPFARDEFFYKVVDAQLTFVRAADGSIKEVVLHQSGRNMRGTKE